MAAPSLTANLDIQYDSDNDNPIMKVPEITVYPHMNRVKLKTNGSERWIEVNLDALSHVLDFRPGYKK